MIEVTSKTTRKEDQTKKPVLYRDVIKVAEYFLFDPTEDYLSPPFQGYRLVEGEYVAIKPVHGRLPSTVLGLHLERSGVDLPSMTPRQANGCRRSEPALLPNANVLIAKSPSESESKPS